MGANSGKVMSQVTVDGTGERGYQSIANLEHAEMNFDAHTEIENGNLPWRGELFHVLARSGDDHSLILDEETPFKVFADVTGIGSEQASQFLVHLEKDLAVIGITRC